MPDAQAEEKTNYNAPFRKPNRTRQGASSSALALILRRSGLPHRQYSAMAHSAVQVYRGREQTGVRPLAENVWAISAPLKRQPAVSYGNGTKSLQDRDAPYFGAGLVLSTPVDIENGKLGSKRGLSADGVSNAQCGTGESERPGAGRADFGPGGFGPGSFSPGVPGPWDWSTGTYQMMMQRMENRGGNLTNSAGAVKVDQNLRVVLVTGSEKSLEFLLPLSSARDENGWKLLDVQVAAIPGIKAEDAQIKQIDVFGDTPGTLNLGKISSSN